jgi:hypothetical protein
VVYEEAMTGRRWDDEEEEVVESAVEELSRAAALHRGRSPGLGGLTAELLTHLGGYSTHSSDLDRRRNANAGALARMFNVFLRRHSSASAVAAARRTRYSPSWARCNCGATALAQRRTLPSST